MKNKRAKLLIAHDVLRRGGRKEMVSGREESLEFEELMPGKFTRYEVSRYLVRVNFHMNKKWLEG